MELLTAYVSRSALLANLAELRRLAGPGAGLCAMVKADAYGHGAAQVAPALAQAGVEFLAVARLEEAQQIRKLGLTGPLLLCEPAATGDPDGYFSDRLAEMCRLEGLRVTVADLAGTEALARTAERLRVRVPVHLKVDTGMGRGGAAPGSADQIARLIESSDGLELEGLYTHLATADEADDRYARLQLHRLSEVVDRWRAGGRRPRYVHAANSAAVARFPDSVLNLARPGLALYGYPPWQADAAPAWKVSLQPVLRLTARLLMVRQLPAGQSVGYGCTWRAARDSRIGLAPIGYGDGYSRRFGNHAVMQVAGQDCPVVGRVSMDLTTIDLSGLPEGGAHVRCGQEVTVISEDPKAANSVANLALLAGTIAYEITCLIGPRVRRALVDSFPGRA